MAREMMCHCDGCGKMVANSTVTLVSHRGYCPKCMRRREYRPRHPGTTCPLCAGVVRTVLDGESWCDACQRYL